MYSMVNLVAGERIVEELIQEACTPEAVAREAVELLTNEARVAEMKEQLAIVRQRLGGSGASQRAADAVLEIARRARGAGEGEDAGRGASRTGSKELGR